jgi:catechol 2,3-dioxygenase-like lactoylglutathione lyase family enzyme
VTQVVTETSGHCPSLRSLVVGKSEPAERLRCQDERVIDHLSMLCSDMAASAAFYDAVLAPVGGGRVVDFGEVIGFGIAPRPTFWIAQNSAGDAFRESHIAFTALDRASVTAFFDAAVAIGAEVLHAPRMWPEYHPNYFGAFVRDPDGNNVEAVCHMPS